MLSSFNISLIWRVDALQRARRERGYNNNNINYFLLMKTTTSELRYHPLLQSVYMTVILRNWITDIMA